MCIIYLGIDLQNLRISSKTSAIDDERSRGYLNTESKTPRASSKLGERTNGKKVGGQMGRK